MDLDRTGTDQRRKLDRHFFTDLLAAPMVSFVKGLLWDRDELSRLLDQRRQDAALLIASWMARRWEIAKAIERHAWDVEAIEKLFVVLGQAVDLDEHWVIREGSEILRLLDRLIARESARPTGLLELPGIVTELCRAWMLLEVRFRPDERGWLRSLRERLTLRAEQLEIDLRGLGV